jgi:2-methylisocitrate lyase-like PEP mutase family enzyme
VFVWGVGRHDITEEEVKRMVEELGMVAVQPGVLTVPVLRDCGVSRISVGPMLFRKAMEVFEREALMLLYALDG